MSGLSIDQSRFVQTLANLSYGTGKKEGASGGKGNMGLFYDKEGKMHIVKCNTHFSQAATAQKKVDIGKNLDLLEASNNLRAEMRKIAKSLGMNDDAINHIIGANEGGKSLLTRKVVAAFVSKVKDTVEASNKENLPPDSYYAEHESSKGNFWKNCEVKKSAWDMSFANIKLSTEKGYNTVALSEKVLAARDARNLLVAQAGKSATLSSLAKAFDEAITAEMKDGKEIPSETFELAKNIEDKFAKVGLDWMISTDKDALHKKVRPALAERFKGIQDDELVEAMTDTFVLRFKGIYDSVRQVGAKTELEEMVRTGSTKFDDILKIEIAKRDEFAIFNISNNAGPNVVKRTLADSLKMFGGDVHEAISQSVWDFMRDDKTAQQKMAAMLKDGTPVFSDIIKDAFNRLKNPFSENSAPPIESIKKALASQMASVDKDKRGAMAMEIWKAGLSTAFAEKFKDMVATGQPAFEKLANDFVGADLEKYGLPSPDAIWNDLESNLSISPLKPSQKENALRTIHTVRQLVAQKDTLIKAIHDAFDAACREAKLNNKPKPDFDDFLAPKNRWGQPQPWFDDFLKKYDVDTKFVWHETSNTIGNLILMIESFANFPSLYSEAKMKDALEDLLAALTEGECAQARLDSLGTFSMKLDNMNVEPPVKHEIGESPESVVQKEVENAVNELRAERGIPLDSEIPFMDVVLQVRSHINGRAFAGISWNKTEIFNTMNRIRENLKREFNIEGPTTKDIDDSWSNNFND